MCSKSKQNGTVSHRRVRFAIERATDRIQSMFETERLAFSTKRLTIDLMDKMRAVQVHQAKGPLEIVEREIPEPQPGWVRVKVEACGVCHSDSLTKEGLWPGIQYPRVPGHEVIGVIDKVGSGVPNWSAGQRVGVGWHGSNCGYCDPCRRGDFFACQVELLITGISFDGGYAEYMVAPAKALEIAVRRAVRHQFDRNAGQLRRNVLGAA